ncbi:MAG: transcriptional regulator FeaR [Oricola sp.]
MLTRIAPATLAVEQFQSRLMEVCGLFRAEPVKGRDTVNGYILLEQRAGIEMAHIAKDLQKVRRSSDDCRRDDGEHFFLVIQEEGRALMSQQDTVRMMHPGDMILIDSARPSEFAFFGSYGRQLSVHLPRTEMRARFGENIRSGLFLSRSDYTALAITSVLAKAFSAQGSPEQDGYLKETMYGLLGVMLHEREGRDRLVRIEADIGGAQLLKQGLAYIDARFDRGDLTIRQIAEDLRVSIRQLQRAFSLIGTSPTDYLVRKRLERACQMLLDRRNGKCDMLVSSIAYACGFSDISNFNRQFRRAFGCSPGRYGAGR